MTAVIITACVVLFFVIILFIPNFKLVFIYDEELDLKIYYAGICFYSSMGREDSNKPKKESILLKLALTEYEHRGFLDALKYFALHIYDLLQKVSGVIEKFKFSVFCVDITVATSDAADTAIQYGTVCSAAYPVLSLLEEFGSFDTKSVNISTDFNKSAYEFKADIRLRVKLIFVIILLIKALIKYLFLLREAKKYERK